MDAQSILSRRDVHDISRSPHTDEKSILIEAQTVDRKEAAKRQVRSVRALSSASLVITMVSLAMMAVVMVRISLPSPGILLISNTFIGRSGVEEQATGWYRVYLDAAVRTAEGLDSSKLQNVATGSLVYVAEAHDRRARILKPVQGWMSFRTKDGVEILRRDETYAGNPEETDLAEVSRSREIRESNKHAQEKAMELTATHKNLMEALKNLHVENMGSHVSRVVKAAPQAGERLAKQAVNELKHNLNEHPQKTQEGARYAELENFKV